MTGNKEKRRAVSREAARKRRCVESVMFEDLSHLLPVPPSVRDHLDKPSIIRLTLSYIRLHQMFRGHSWTDFFGHDLQLQWENGEDRDGRKTDHVKPTEGPDESSMFLNILEGFLMVLSTEGVIVFLSDNVNGFIGLTQTELMGHNIFEFTHPCDHEEIRTNLRFSPEEVWGGAMTDFVIRFKSALTHRGRSTNLKSAIWKVLHCRGRAQVSVACPSVSCLLLTCQALPLSHMLLNDQTFTSQHSMDMRFTHCDHRVTLLLGYRPEELMGRSIYELSHALDTSCLTKNHMNLFLRSQSVSGRFRMLVRGGGYVWVESHSAVLPIVGQHRSRSSANHQTLCILCVTYVLSGVEQPSVPFSLGQTAPRYMSWK